LADMAALLRLKPVELSRILAVAPPLPLARSAGPDDAARIVEGLGAMGIETVIIPNDDLHLDQPVKKIRAVEFRDDSLTGFATASDAQVSLAWDEITLVVTGRLLSNRLEVEERQRRGRKQTVDSRQLSADESALDLYTKTQAGNYRILAGSFDFSCLGPAKSVTTFQNFAVLVNLLRERAPNARFDDAYTRIRSMLELVWPLEAQVKTGDRVRRAAGKFDTTTVTATDNEAQFTRYSRMRQCLRLRELENLK